LTLQLHLTTFATIIHNHNVPWRPPTKRYVRVIALRHVRAALTNPRVYVRNLEERIKVDQLKEALTELFGEYGEIIDIVAKTNLKAKGQAFIVFDSTESAQKAIDEVQGFELFEKPMQLAFAKTRSDASVKRSGDEDEFESHKRRRLAEKGMTFIYSFPLGFTQLTHMRLYR
jgi:RNA recognition motif-containing protein